MPLRAGTIQKSVRAFVLLEFYPPTDATMSSRFLDPSPYSVIVKVQCTGSD
ncbi:hypothetical protein MC7420_318 [Coleofasciculus chthonoplastes PCC 7420]|uniref:Uncharacterized protein n=1 Tax=Coleofasciculus chthonoplastes PCC 7420 TaxID=118168 RepID=B4VLF7_9CYAN|nr:hypothetical protein MC7420_2109 [Coleofasciculus chthonoplastes PCC 7420]EDX77181.1 hypothetical protein MC7420_318 [Coleofasciculus chthonoplastes PCC 7420]